MSRRGRRGPLWLGAIVGGLVLAGHRYDVRGGVAGEVSVRVVFPADRCIVESGRFELLCVASPLTASVDSPLTASVDSPLTASVDSPLTASVDSPLTALGGQHAVPLRVDGKPQPWDPYQPPLLLRRLELTPGRHEIVVGRKRLWVFVRGEGRGSRPPNGWPVLRSHPGGPEQWKDCATCHQTTKEEGRLAVGDFQTPSRCDQCHSAAEFELAHFHPKGPLASCQRCHALHASSNPSLLRAAAKQLCASCHD
jgi:predicted CXXCH cytochrome family protein